MMSTCCSKHVEAWNKHTEEECIKLVIIQNYLQLLVFVQYGINVETEFQFNVHQDAGEQ